MKTTGGIVLALLLSIPAACSSGDPSSVDGPDGGAGSGGTAGSGGGGGDGGPRCGAGAGALCADGAGCAAAADCKSGVCSQIHTCIEASATDGRQDGSETDVDCGGPAAVPCADHKKCLVGSDCTDLVCDKATQTCDPPTSTDGVKNGNESDVDCGSSGSGVDTKAPACVGGKGCGAATDCASGVCDPNTKTCGGPTATDGVKDGNESDVDCGSSGSGADTKAPVCADGKACAAGGDCKSGSCDPKKKTCSPPTSTDGQKNGNETDVDCGSSGAGVDTKAPPCAAGKGCAASSDCASNGCGYNGKCASAASCTQHHGGDTCGANGTDDCCASLPVATDGNKGLDKYPITAGRMRAFIEATNGNIRAWIQAHRPAGFDPSWDQYLPVQIPAVGFNTYDSTEEQLGPFIYGSTGAGNNGCYISAGKAARTFWLSPLRNAYFANDVQAFTQDEMDEKALNCVTFYMNTALCAYDGKHLQTSTRHGAAISGSDGRMFPWGNTPVPTGYDARYLTEADAIAHGKPKVAGGDVHTINYFFNYWFPGPPAQMAMVPVRDEKTGMTIGGQGEDWTIFVAPPGRFPKGNGPYGHADLLGLMIEQVSDGGGGFITTGAYDGHPYTLPLKLSVRPHDNKYLAIGGRCEE